MRLLLCAISRLPSTAQHVMEAHTLNLCWSALSLPSCFLPFRFGPSRGGTILSTCPLASRSQCSAVFDGGHIDAGGRCGSCIIDLSQPGGYRVLRRGTEAIAEACVQLLESTYELHALVTVEQL